MPTSLGPAEILVILVVALIVLGPSRLPQAGRQVGKAFAEMRKWSSSVQREIRDVIESEPDPSPTATEPAPTKLTGDAVPEAPAPPDPPSNGSAAEPPRN